MKFKGRVTVLVALMLVLTGCLLGVTLNVWESPTSWLIAICSVALSSLLTVTIIEFMRARKSLSAKLGGIQLVQDTLGSRVSALHKKVDTLTDYAGSNLRLARQTSTLLNKIQSMDAILTSQNGLSSPDPGAQNAGSVSHTQPAVSESIFAPSYLEATPIQSKPNAHLPGRLAAAQLAQNPSEIKYEALLDPKNGTTDRNVYVVGSSKTAEVLEAVSKPQILYPHFSKDQIGIDAGYLIIDEGEIPNSPWAGVLNAQSTEALRKLLEIISIAQQRHIVIVVLSSDIVEHNSLLIRHKAAVTVGSYGIEEDLPWGDDLKLPMLDVCVNYMKGD